MSPKSDSPDAAKSADKDDKKPEKSKEPKEEELSEDDRTLKEELDLCVTRLTEADSGLYSGALESLRKLIRASTTSMTSVPKPLKFMIEHYDTMKAVYEKIDGSSLPQVKSDCADIVSVLSMTMGEKNECLKFKLLGDTSLENLEAWGHEYVRHLAGEIVAEWNAQDETPEEGADQVKSFRPFWIFVLLVLSDYLFFLGDFVTLEMEEIGAWLSYWTSGQTFMEKY